MSLSGLPYVCHCYDYCNSVADMLFIFNLVWWNPVLLTALLKIDCTLLMPIICQKKKFLYVADISLYKFIIYEMREPVSAHLKPDVSVASRCR